MYGKNNLQTDFIHVVYVSSSQFMKATAASIVSLFDNTNSKVCIHLLHDKSTTFDCKRKLLEMASKYSQQIIFYNPSEYTPDVYTELHKLSKKISWGREDLLDINFFRMTFMQVLPTSVKKAIFMDSDTIINMDIRKMWEQPVGENGFAAVSEVEATFNHMLPKGIVEIGLVKSNEDYFCDGIFMVDMDKHRQHMNLAADGLKMLAENPKCDLFSQDIHNYYFSDKYYKLPVWCDTFTDGVRLVEGSTAEPKEAIYHYAGRAVNITSINDKFDELFFKYYCMTPFFDGSQFLRIVKDTLMVKNQIDLQFMKSIRGRKLAIAGNKDVDVKRLVDAKIFSEEVQFINIYDENTINIGRLIEFMKSNGVTDNIYIILSSNYDIISKHLNNQGFREWKDFVDGNIMFNAPMPYTRGRIYNI